MTRVDSDAWIRKAKKRKAYRDHYREKFFRDVGLKKGAHIQEIGGAPLAQAKLVQQLLSLTAKGSVPDDEQRSHINAAIEAFTAVGLGAGNMGGTAANQEKLDQYSMRALRDNWFYSPAFFD